MRLPRRPPTPKILPSRPLLAGGGDWPIRLSSAPSDGWKKDELKWLVGDELGMMRVLGCESFPGNVSEVSASRVGGDVDSIGRCDDEVTCVSHIARTRSAPRIFDRYPGR